MCQPAFYRVYPLKCDFPHTAAKPSSVGAAGRSGGAAQTSSLRAKALELLRKLKMSMELLIALAALLSWVVVGVVMFDFVEYKAVPGKFQYP